jgi:predicted HTH domain antitoxin
MRSAALANWLRTEQRSPRELRCRPRELQILLVASPCNQNFNADKRLTIARTSRGAWAPRLSVQSRSFARVADSGGGTIPTISFDLPEGALSALRLSPTEFVKEMRVAAASLWYSQGEISQSKAAEIAGTSRAEFIDELAHRRIPVVQVTAEELQNEIGRE